MSFVTRVDPRGHALTSRLLDALGTAGFPRLQQHGLWLLPLGEQPVDDRSRPASYRRGTLHLSLAALDLPPGVELRCHNYFPWGGGMDWHTDSGSPGWRVYVFRGGDGSSTFGFRDRLFAEGPVGGYVFETGVGSWHSVQSYRDRWSCGVQVSEAIAREVIAAAALP